MERLSKMDPWKTKPGHPSYEEFSEPENKYNPEIAEHLTCEQVFKALEDHAWRFAKTMPQWPHEYVIRQNWKSDIPWENVVQHMRVHGKAGYFSPSGKRRTPQIYYVFGGYVFWSMGYALNVTTVINRATDEPQPYYYYDPES